MSTLAFSLATNEYGNQNKDLLLLQCRKSLGKSELIRIRPVANTILGFDANGDPATYTAGDLIIIEGALPLSGGTMTGAIILAVGAANAPSLGFAGDTTTGFYRFGSGQASFTSVGTSSLIFDGTGKIYGSGGAILPLLQLNPSTGAIGLTASGTNQSITLTPSGTGRTIFGSGGFSSPTAGTGIAYGNAANGLTFGGNGSTNDLLVVNSGGSTTLVVPHNTQNILLGGLATNGTGVLQFPAATTSAGGITLGTDTNVFRSAAGTIVLNNTGTDSALLFASGGTTKGAIGATSAGVTTIYSNGLSSAIVLNAVQLATFASHVNLASGNFYGWTAQGGIKSPSDGVITLLDNANTSFSRLQFGGATSSFPALKRSGAILVCEVADDSAFATFQCASLRANGAAVSASASEISYGGTTASTVGAAGGASALPATPTGYAIINVAGTQMKIPYYAN